jgi:predicted nuclease of predicted toxin-antitoxin system
MFSELKILCDENIHPDVVDYLIGSGLDLQSIKGLNLSGLDDEQVLAYAFQNDQVVITHDSDFGTLVIAEQKPFYGIVYLKLGHILPKFTIESLDALLKANVKVDPPFIIVIKHQFDAIRIRVRQM